MVTNRSEMRLKRSYQNLILLAVNFLIIVYPIIIFCLKTNDLSYMVTSSFFAIPVASLLSMVRDRRIFLILVLLAAFGSIVEVVMVAVYGTFIMSGNLSALLTTNAQESSDFIRNNIAVALHFIPLAALTSSAVLIHFRIKLKLWCQLAVLGASLVLSSAYITYKQFVFYHSLLTNRFYIEKNILTRPPYNLCFQSVNTVKAFRMRRLIKESEGFTFGAERVDSLSGIKESYVLAIGESMRYSNVSLNGVYPRTTTPHLESLDNLVSYSNYYSTAVQTLYSVPMIITRATPETFDLSYKEKSIIAPFKEVGFKTFAITDNLLGEHGQEYLTDGVDSLYRVKKDKDIPVIVDSLTRIYPKTFFVVQFYGCHSFYENYEEEYDVYHPNRNSEPDAGGDSLWINAYDNTILYADYILGRTIRSIDKPDAVSSLIFVSDHGENITSGGGGHAANCKPMKQEYHVPCVVWYSAQYRTRFPERVEHLAEHKDRPVCGDNIFYSVCDLGGIILPDKYPQGEYSFLSDSFMEHSRSVLLPDGVNILRCE